MGKRVKKNRRAPAKEKHHSPKAVSQEKKTGTKSVEDEVSVMKERKPCPHLDKIVGLDELSAKLRSSESIRCEDCREGVGDRRGTKGKSKHGKKKASGSVDSKSESKAIWVCLDCGHFACAGVGLPTASQTHALRHIRQTHHRLMIRWDNPQLRWCFSCSTLIPAEKTEENGESKDVLSEVVKVIKERSSEASSVDVEDVWFGSGSITSEIKAEGTTSSGLGGRSESAGYVAPGLVNLGNTCFFNSIMQNLLALGRLRAYFFSLDASMGPLTISLKKLFAETKPEAGLKNVINPRAFFGCICSKAPQFRGYQQHDSHELLRCLLDELCTEELSLRKRSNAFKEDAVSSSHDPTFVDAVFGGQISSTLRCVDCGYSSTVYEPFLDLSLPVPNKKTPPKRVEVASRGKKPKLPPKKGVRTRPKVNKQVATIQPHGASNPSRSSESSVPGSSTVSQMESRVESSGASTISDCVSINSKADESGSISQSHSAVLEPENKQEFGKEHRRAASMDESTWMDYLGSEIISGENDLTSQNNDSPFVHDLGSKDRVLNEDIAESSIVCSADVGLNQKPNDTYGNACEDELPLLVKDSEVLLLPYKEDDHNTGKFTIEAAATSSTMGGQEELDFGFSDLFNEPEITTGPVIGPSLASEVSGTSFMAGSSSDSDPNEVDDTDSPVSVESCLAHFIKPELLFDDNAWDCENCSKTMQRQKLDVKKRQVRVSKTLSNGDNTQSQFELSSFDKDVLSPIGVKSVITENMSAVDHSTSEAQVSHNGTTDVIGDASAKIENGEMSELNTVVDKCDKKHEMENASLEKLNSLAHFRSCVRKSCKNQAIGSCSIQDNDGTDKVQQSDSKMVENNQSQDSEDDEINSLIVKRNATKRVLINKAPPILTIHLKRFSQDTRGRLSKLNGHVDFREMIDLTPYLDPSCVDKERCTYCLVGIVEHSGTMRGGHYVAYVRGGEKRGGKADAENCVWYYISDTQVRQVSLEEVLRSEAYILFYERN